MNLKERFENYESQPDGQVWLHVKKALRQRKLWRYGAMAGAVAVLMGAAVVAYWPKETAAPVAGNAVPIAVPGSAYAPAGVSASEAETPAAALVAAGGSAAERQGGQPSALPAKVAAPASPQVVSPTGERAVPMALPAPLPSKAATVAPIAASASSRTAAQGNAAAMQHQGDEHPAVAAAAAQDDKGDKRVAVNRNTAKTKVPAATDSDSLMVWIPNAFSPQDESGADVRVFRVRAKEGADIRNFKMYIYNRAGAQVYRGYDITAGWDGNYRGEACPMGTYVYLIEFSDGAKGVQHARGTITLIR